MPASAVTVFSHSACCGSTTFGAVGPTCSPKIQSMPMRISVTPMTRMMVPVTTGGKKRRMRLITGASSMAITPAPISAPKIIRAPSMPGWTRAMEIIGPTAAKVTPIITGMRMPKSGVQPSDWMIDTSPQAKRSAEIRNATCSGARPSTRPMISGTAMAPAYMTSTCWMPSVNRRAGGSISSTGWQSSDIPGFLP